MTCWPSGELHWILIKRQTLRLLKPCLSTRRDFDLKNVTVSRHLLISRSTNGKFWVTHLPTASSVFPEPLLLSASLTENHFLWVAAPVPCLLQSSQLPFHSAPTSHHSPHALPLYLLSE